MVAAAAEAAPRPPLVQTPRTQTPRALPRQLSQSHMALDSPRHSAATASSVGSKRKADPDSQERRKRSRGQAESALVNYGRMKNIYQHCEKLLDILMRDKASLVYFNMPVDPVNLGTLPHVHSICFSPCF